jgi:hypothetical protein
MAQRVPVVGRFIFPNEEDIAADGRYDAGEQEPDLAALAHGGRIMRRRRGKASRKRDALQPHKS